MDVTLTDHEVEMAAFVGLRRQLASVAAGLRDAAGMRPEDGWTNHIEGACGELAVAKFLGKYWDGSVNTFRAIPDLGSVEIRTRSRHDYELLIRENDSDNRAYVLVTGRAPNFVVRGWMWGRDAKRPEWLRTHGGRPPAYFVPHHALETTFGSK